MVRKLVMEAVGTFFLVATIGLVVLEPGAGAMGPLAIGAVLMVMVYAGGHISGAHYNPAVTLAVLVRGWATRAELLGYTLAQLAAALVAAVLVLWLKGGATSPVAVPADALAVFVAEALFTFALVWVILNVATSKGTEGNSYFGLAIGFTVTAGAYAIGPISGAALNPAVAIAAVAMGLVPLAGLWVYLVAQLAAGAAAALLFNALDLGYDKATTATAAEQAELRGAAEMGT